MDLLTPTFNAIRELPSCLHMDEHTKNNNPLTSCACADRRSNLAPFEVISFKRQMGKLSEGRYLHEAFFQRQSSFNTPLSKNQMLYLDCNLSCFARTFDCLDATETTKARIAIFH